MSNEIVSLGEMEKLANAVAKSGLFGIKTAEQALTLMAISQAEGRHPALAARDYHILPNGPSKKAEAMHRDYLAAGGKVEWHEMSDDAAEATFSHPSGGTVRIRWDKKRAEQAGLKSDMYRKYPRAMYRSRVVSEGIRATFPAATSGMYVPEEVVEFEPKRQPPIDVTLKQDLDAFAKPDEAIDHDSGEIKQLPPWHAGLIAGAHEKVKEGEAGFKAWYKTLPPEQRDALKAEDVAWLDLARAADAAKRGDLDDDPFGLPPQPAAAEPEPAGSLNFGEP